MDNEKWRQPKPIIQVDTCGISNRFFGGGYGKKCSNGRQAFRVLDVQGHQGAAGGAQAATSGCCADCHHHGLAADSDRPLHRGRYRRVKLFGALYDEIDEIPDPGAA